MKNDLARSFSFAWFLPRRKSKVFSVLQDPTAIDWSRNSSTLIISRWLSFSQGHIKQSCNDPYESSPHPIHILHSFIHSFIHSVRSLSHDRSTSLPKPVLHSLRSVVSSFNFYYLLVSLIPSSSCLRLFLHLLVPCSNRELKLSLCLINQRKNDNIWLWIYGLTHSYYWHYVGGCQLRSACFCSAQNSSSFRHSSSA